MSELRVMRQRHMDAADALDRSADLPPYGSDAQCAKTTTIETYPTSATAFYACNPVQITGTQTEGAAATLTVDASTVIYAENVGSQIPPSGTYLVIHSVNSRWCFRYDG